MYIYLRFSVGPLLSRGNVEGGSGINAAQQVKHRLHLFDIPVLAYDIALPAFVWAYGIPQQDVMFIALPFA